MEQQTDRYRASLAKAGAALLSTVLCFATGATEVSGTGNARLDLKPHNIAKEPARAWLAVGARRFSVRLEDNPTALELKQMLPVTFDMTELNGNEKLVRLPRSLTINEIRPGTIRTGDVLLYGNDTLVVFYKTFQSSYSYTRIGRIEDSAGLTDALGPGNPRVTFAPS